MMKRKHPDAPAAIHFLDWPADILRLLYNMLKPLDQIVLRMASKRLSMLLPKPAIPDACCLPHEWVKYDDPSRLLWALRKSKRCTTVGHILQLFLHALRRHAIGIARTLQMQYSHIIQHNVTTLRLGNASDITLTHQAIIDGGLVTNYDGDAAVVTFELFADLYPITANLQITHPLAMYQTMEYSLIWLRYSIFDWLACRATITDLQWFYLASMAIEFGAVGILSILHHRGRFPIDHKTPLRLKRGSDTYNQLLYWLHEMGCSNACGYLSATIPQYSTNAHLAHYRNHYTLTASNFAAPLLYT